MVTIYRFQTYDVHADQMKESRRWGTREAVRDIVCGKVIESSAVDVDESAIESDIQGLTAIDYNPRPRKDFGGPPKVRRDFAIQY